MNLQGKVAGFAAAAVLLTGITFAQRPDSGKRAHGPGLAMGGFGMPGMDGRRLDFLATHLELTEAQKTQAKTIFEAAHASSKPLFDQLKQGRQQMAEAVKANRPAAEIDSLAAKQGDLLGQIAGTQAKAFASFYATLTPEQKQKAGEMRDRFKEGRRSHADRGAGSTK